MKILFLFPHFILPGGAAKVTLDFARGLEKSGDTVEILCANASEEFLKNNSDLKITRLKIPNSNSFRYWAFFPYWQYKINKSLDKYPDHVLFPQVFPSNWWAWIYKSSHPNRRAIWYCNEPSAFIHSRKWIDAIPSYLMRIGAKVLNPVLKMIDLRLEKQDDLVICNSRFTAEEYERCYNRKAAGVVYPPLEIKTAPPETEKDNYFFTISRLSKFKNVDLLIEAFAKFSASRENYKLIIAGDGEEKEDLQKIARDKKLENRISFLGKISDGEKEILYQKGLATILCSHNEPFGLVPIESMMQGTPVIAHRSGGPKETIVDGKNGFLFEDIDDLAEKMAKTADLEKETYFEMQKNCQKEVKKYDYSNSISKLIHILKTTK